MHSRHHHSKKIVAMKRARKSSEKAGNEPKKLAKSKSSKTGDQDEIVVSIFVFMAKCC